MLLFLELRLEEGSEVSMQVEGWIPTLLRILILCSSWIFFFFALTFIFKKHCIWEFPGGPVVRTPRFHFRGMGSIPGWGTKIPQAAQYGQKQKQTKKLH